MIWSVSRQKRCGNLESHRHCDIMPLPAWTDQGSSTPAVVPALHFHVGAVMHIAWHTLRGMSGVCVGARACVCLAYSANSRLNSRQAATWGLYNTTPTPYRPLSHVFRSSVICGFSSSAVFVPPQSIKQFFVVCLSYFDAGARPHVRAPSRGHHLDRAGWRSSPQCALVS